MKMGGINEIFIMSTVAYAVDRIYSFSLFHLLFTVTSRGRHFLFLVEKIVKIIVKV